MTSLSRVLFRRLITVAMVLCGAVGFASTSLSQMSQSDKVVGKDGSISLPSADYRKNWTMLGAWSVDNDEDKAGAKGMHVVYTQPSSVEAYRKTGKFPDGAVLIKELFGTTTEDMTTGTISRVKETQGWFVMVKDSKNKYPGNKLWGDGWGWAFFKAGNPKQTVTKNYKDECLGCHVPAQNTDWVYIQGYPVLKK